MNHSVRSIKPSVHTISILIAILSHSLEVTGNACLSLLTCILLESIAICPHHHAIIRAAFVCLCVCLFVPYVLQGPLTDLRQTWWVYVGWPPICPWGVLFRKGQRVTFAFHYIIYAPASCHTAAKAPLACWLSCSLIRRLLLLHHNGIGRWTWQLLLWGVLFLKGQRVDGSTGSNGSTGHFHYIIYDSRWRHVHGTQLQKAHWVNGLTGQWVNGSNGSTGHFHFHYIIYDSRPRQAHATPLQKAHGVWWHQAHATPLQKAYTIFCSLDG